MKSHSKRSLEKSTYYQKELTSIGNISIGQYIEYELSSLRSQLEYWNTGMKMGQWFTLLNRVPSGKFNRVNWQNST